MRVVCSVFLATRVWCAFTSLAIGLHYTRLMVFLLHDSDFLAQTTNIFSLRSLSLPLSMKYLQFFFCFFFFGLVIHHTAIKAYGFSFVNSTSGAVCMDSRENSCSVSPTETSGVIHFSPCCCWALRLHCNEDVQPYNDRL